MSSTSTQTDYRKVTIEIAYKAENENRIHWLLGELERGRLGKYPAPKSMLVGWKFEELKDLPKESELQLSSRISLTEEQQSHLEYIAKEYGRRMGRRDSDVSAVLNDWIERALSSIKRDRLIPEESR